MRKVVSEAIDSSQLSDWGREVGWDQVYQQVGKGKFHAWGSAAFSDEMLFTNESCNRDMVIIGSPPPGTVVLGLTLPGERFGLLNGVPLETHGVGFILPDREFAVSSVMGMKVCTVSVPLNRLNSALWHYGNREVSQILSQSQCVLFPPALHLLLAKTVSAVANGDVRPTAQSAAAELEEQILLAIAEGLWASMDDPTFSSRGLRNRLKHVRIAKDYIEAQLEDVVRMSDVAAVAGITTRSMEYAFRDILSVTPVEYLRTRRLNRVRQKLLNSRYREAKVTDVAMVNGLCHLGHFSQDYRALFGESPSVTLSNGKG